MRIKGLRWRLTRIREAPVQLWLLQPWPPLGETEHYCYGKRIIERPRGAVLSATWFEAWLYAHQPGALTMPRPIEHVYPEYCGLVNAGQVMRGPAGPGPLTNSTVCICGQSLFQHNPYRCVPALHQNPIACTCPTWGNPNWPHRHGCPVLSDA